MGMFSNYENLNSNYYPDNTKEFLPLKREEYQDKLPHKEYDFYGDFWGYSWNYGDTFNLDIDINPLITVEEDAIIYIVEGDAPTSSTQGHFHQMAYNTYDFKCWTCVSQNDQSVYEWVLLDKFLFPKNLEIGQQIRLQQYKDVDGLKGTLRIQSFRYEDLCSFDINGSDTISVVITQDISAKLLKGIYYGIIELGNESDEVYSESKSVLYTVPLLVK